MKKLLVLLIAASLLLVPASAFAQDGGGGTLVGAFDVGPGGCPECIPLYETAGRVWMSKIWSPLTSLNEDASDVVPQLATEWDSNDEATVWTFKLREGVVWHDGEPFDAEDVKFSYELAVNPSAATIFVQTSGIDASGFEGGEAFANGEADEISGIRIVDDMTVEFRFLEPRPRFPFAAIFGWILPQHLLSDVNPAELQNSDWFFTNPVGTGPFMHSQYEEGQFWELVPNPNYWDGEPKLDRLINRYFEDETSAVLALESGEIHFTFASGDVALRMGESERFELFPGPSGVTNYMIFNFRSPVFDDVRVRQAFLYAIDRAAITEVVLNGTAEPAPCLNAFPTMWPDEYNDYAYDPDMARELLAEAGWDSSQSYEVVTYYDSQFHMDALAAIQQYLAEVGINVIPTPQDVPTYNSYFYTGEGWNISYRGLGNNVANYPFAYYESGGFPDAEGGTLRGQAWPELDEMIAQAKVETDPDVYLQLLKDICAFQNENAVEGYMWVATRFGVASTDLVDFYWFPAVGGGPYADHAENWAVAE